MQFIVLAYDFKDEGALERRMEARQSHLKGCDLLLEQRKLLYATALIDQQGKMQGSVMVLDFINREELDSWLSSEPYVIGKVWDRIEVQLCREAPCFANQRSL